jgi:hypothetical protein
MHFSLAKPQFDPSEPIYDVPSAARQTQVFTSPYSAPDGTTVKFQRSATGFFAYSAAVPDKGVVRLVDDLIVFEPTNPFLVNFFGGSQITIRLLEHSIFFDGERVVFRTNLGAQSSIGRDGTFCTEKAGTLMLVERDGRVSKRRHGRWSSFDKDGNVTENGRRDDHSVFFTRDFSANRRRMIRSDHIEYSVCADGTRMIFHQDDFSIVQYPDSIEYDLPNFPLATWRDGAISLVIGPLTFTCADAVTGSGEGFSLAFRGGELSLAIGEHSIVASADSLTVAGREYRICGDRSGAQLFEVGDTYTPEDILHRRPPRLFAVRNDLSLMEFVRDEDPRFVDAELRASRVPGHRLSIVTAHFAGPREPFAVVEFAPQSREDRDAVVAAADAPPKEGEGTFEAAMDAKQGYLEAVAALDELVRGCLMREHGAFLSGKSSRSLLELALRKHFHPPSR